MKRLGRWQWTAIVFAALLVLAQFVPKRVDNPPVRQEPPWDSPRTRELAVVACFNCHSNETRVAWFEHVAPLSWWIASHVDEGREKLNFSEYNPSRHKSGKKVAEPVEESEMPPGNYTWLFQHSEAKLSAAERKELADGLRATYGAGAGQGGSGRH